MAGVYISYPFCAQKCTYCNFASGVFPKQIERDYIETLLATLRTTNWPWTPETVYLGGGTPSNAPPEVLSQVLASVPGAPWREATIEAAPGNLTRDSIVAWRRSFINRISLGTQSFVQKELARTGRKHTPQIVEQEVALLREYGMESINLDLIAGLPGQTQASWLESLAWVEKLNVPHVSVYMLEVDEDSRLGSEIIGGGVRYGAGDIPEEDAVADFYEIAVERLAAMGIPRYEISNFARPGFESVHNLKYWKREPYLGFGADAHSFDGDQRWQNPETPLEFVRTGLLEPIRTPADAQNERFLLGLRLSAGVSGELKPYERIFQRYEQDGLIEREGDFVRLTPRGVLLSNEVFQAFVP